MRSRAFSIVVLSISVVAALSSASGPALPPMPSPDATQDAAYAWTDAQEAARWAAWSGPTSAGIATAGC